MKSRASLFFWNSLSLAGKIIRGIFKAAHKLLFAIVLLGIVMFLLTFGTIVAMDYLGIPPSAYMTTGDH